MTETVAEKEPAEPASVAPDQPGGDNTNGDTATLILPRLTAGLARSGPLAGPVGLAGHTPVPLLRLGWFMPGSGRLPAPLSTFVGRDAEISELAALIDQARLVSVTGLGGSGKSRLALAVAQRVASGFPDAVWWVPLAQVTDPATVVDELAGAVRLAESEARPRLAGLLDRLRAARALLVIDTCEHLGDAVAQVVEELLVDCVDLRVLATSQRRLGVPGEVAWPVPPLSIPVGQAAVADLTAYESVRLFVDRARSALPQFDLNEGNIAAIGAVCQRLEGIPLAIELAAARVNVLSVQQIAARLDDALGLLVGGNRTAVVRHRSLRAALDWSFALLGQPERRLLAELSVFDGSFDLDAVEAMHRPIEAMRLPRDADQPPAGWHTAGSRHRPQDAGQPLDVLTELVDRSWVTVLPAGQRVRYRLPELVRQYATDQLRTLGEVPFEARRPGATSLAARGVAGTPDTTNELRIQALGAARVRRGSTLIEPSAWTYAKPRELLYFLLSHPNSTKEQIGAALWPSTSPANLRNSFHTTLHRLRQALGDPGWVTHRHGRYAFNRDRPYRFDVEIFEAGLAHMHSPEPDALPYLVAAVEAYRGDFLADLPGEQWIDVRRDELRTAFEQLLLALGGRYAQAGQFAQAVQTYERAIRHDNLIEDAHRELIRCYGAMGERARAVRHYNHLVTLLHDQLGIQPSAETQSLYRTLRYGAAPPPSPRNSPSI